MECRSLHICTHRLLRLSTCHCWNGVAMYKMQELQPDNSTMYALCKTICMYMIVLYVRAHVANSLYHSIGPRLAYRSRLSGKDRSRAWPNYNIRMYVTAYICQLTYKSTESSKQATHFISSERESICACAAPTATPRMTRPTSLSLQSISMAGTKLTENTAKGLRA